MTSHETNALVVRDAAGPPGMPVLSIEEALQRHQSLIEFTQKIMVKDLDYGAVPGTGDKPTLLKPGAEKLCAFFGLAVRYEDADSVIDWKGGFFHYSYRCVLYRNGQPVGEGIGSCNSRETKYRYRWVARHELPPNVKPENCKSRGGMRAEPDFAIDKGETTGKYGKPAEYWDEYRRRIANGTARKVEKDTRSGGKMTCWEIDVTQYRVENEDIAEVVNTLQKMAQKRALVAAVLVTVGASQFYTQDIEDLDLGGDTASYVPPRNEAAPVDVSHTVRTEPAARPSRTSQVADRLKRNGTAHGGGGDGPVIDVTAAQESPADHGERSPFPPEEDATPKEPHRFDDLAAFRADTDAEFQKRGWDPGRVDWLIKGCLSRREFERLEDSDLKFRLDFWTKLLGGTFDAYRLPNDLTTEDPLVSGPKKRRVAAAAK